MQQGVENLENLENLNLEFLTYREFEPNNPHEREKIFSDPTMEMMLASLTNMMKEHLMPTTIVCVKSFLFAFSSNKTRVVYKHFPTHI